MGRIGNFPVELIQSFTSLRFQTCQEINFYRFATRKIYRVNSFDQTVTDDREKAQKKMSTNLTSSR